MSNDGESAKEAGPPVGMNIRAVNQWLKIKEHAETYPYVWGSYILVYGGLGAHFAYRRTKLRRTEDQVRILQTRLRKLVEKEESEPASALGSNGPPPSTAVPPSSLSSSSYSYGETAK